MELGSSTKGASSVVAWLAAACLAAAPALVSSSCADDGLVTGLLHDGTLVALSAGRWGMGKYGVRARSDCGDTARGSAGAYA